MKKLKIESLFKICLFVFVNVYFNNIFIFIISLILLFNKNIFNIIIFILTLSIILLNNNINNDYIKFGFVDYKYDNYVIVNKILYKCKVYKNNDLDVGDIVYFDASDYKTLNENNLKNNIKYEYGQDIKKVSKNNLKSIIFKYINSTDYKDIYNSIYYNVTNYEYDDLENLSYNLAFYYILILIFRRNKNISIILLALYSIMFGFQIKIILIIINYFLSFLEMDKIDKLSIKLLIVIFINKYLYYNYSILISLLFSSVFSFGNFKNDSVIIGIIQSICFGEVKLFSSLFYKLYIFEKIFIFILACISLVFRFFEGSLIFILNILNKIMGIFDLSLRGKLSIVVIILFVLIIKKLRINNQYLKYLLFIIVMLIPFNQFIKHVDFIDVGQGDSALIVDPIGFKTILIDTGSKYNYYKLKKELFNEGIYKIDYLVISHNDSDHNGNIDNLKKDFKINNIIEQGIDINTNSLKLSFIELGKYDNDNDNSLVYLLDIDGYKMLFTGDLSSSVENKIIFDKNINDIDVLKVSHHGSKSATSSYFVGCIKPEFAIISTNGMYNHPHESVVETLNKFNVNTFITKNVGCIKFCFTNFIDYIKTSNNRFVIINK